MMASPTVTVTLPVPAESSAGSWSKVTSPAFASSQNASSSPGTPDTPSDSSNDVSYWFEQMGVPQHAAWADKFYKAGYCDMDDVANLDAAAFEAVFKELSIPSGIQNKLRVGVPKFKAKTLGKSAMPQTDLDETAPVQKQYPRLDAFLGLAGGVTLLGGAAATAIGFATGGPLVGGVRAAMTLASVGSIMAADFAIGDCLDGETLVTMADRSEVKIKDVRAGDKILSYNKGKLRVKTVLEVKMGSSGTMRDLLLQGPDGKDFSIRATGGHPFYTKGNAWAVISPDDAHFDASKPAKKLAVGDTLVLRSGAGVKLMQIGEVLPTQKTYNLIIDGPGTFFVEGILSHSGLPPAKK